ncbi:Pal1 cell morphology [Kalmanozyma brasiliensis GHG001]|uniref:Pal1 cell morphology protein n=1 Tax=Kalmanozyma brasiliensis (strain GHG001) TaxID=1365824 RepID=V5GGX8_KALBG|nr:Pal1 cell morphology [Kalmanozyma brasiliensis GHG001]EST05262.1 Pal1 cell morphology [Kalmanozyma brasiliensis GHG001]
MAYRNTSRQAVLDALSDVVTVNPNVETDRARSSRHAHHPSYDPESSYHGLQPLPHSEPPPMVPAKSPFEDRSLPPPPEVPSKSGNTMASKFANAFRKQSADDKAKKRAKDKRLNDEINKTTAKASRMDIIDRLDLSGINGSSMFHHDSPYDACAPHMNAGKRAPVGAFDPNVDPMTGLQRNAAGGKRGSRVPAQDGSPVDEKSGAVRPGLNAKGGRSRSSTAPLVPSLSMHAQGSATELPLDEEVDADRDADAERVWRSRQGYHTQPSNVPESRYDVSNPNADVWGVSAEPWQDFAQPKARVRSTLSPYSAGNGDASGTTSAASSVLDMEAIMTGQKKPSRRQEELATGSASPFPEPNYDDRALAVPSDGPKRNKSLIKRIRSMRDNPNVPPPEDGVEMGVRGSRRRAAHKHSPSTPPMRTDSVAGSGASSYEARAAAADAATGATSGSYSRRTGRTVVTPNERDVITPRAGRDEDSSYFQGQQAGRSPTNEGGLTRSGSLFDKLRRGQKPKSTERAAAYT